jgi:hypothetical protein
MTLSLTLARHPEVGRPDVEATAAPHNEPVQDRHGLIDP